MKNLFLVLALFVVAFANGSERKEIWEILWDRDCLGIEDGDAAAWLQMEEAFDVTGSMIRSSERKKDLHNLAYMGGERARAAIRRLCAEGMDINAPNEEGKFVLHGQLFMGREEDIEFILSMGADPNKSQKSIIAGDSGGTALHALVRYRRLELGAFRDDKSWRERELSELQKKWTLLCSKGADSSIKDSAGRTAKELYNELVAELSEDKEKS